MTKYPGVLSAGEKGYLRGETTNLGLLVSYLGLFVSCLWFVFGLVTIVNQPLMLLK